MLNVLDRYRNRTALGLSLAALIVCASAPAGAEAGLSFKITGRGYGHGVGMSQWGAYGLAEQGKSHEHILAHYYRGTKIGEADARKLNVLLSTRSGSVGFSGARKACGRKLEPSASYVAEISRSGRKVRLERADGRKLTSCGAKLAARPDRKIEISGDGVYRGDLVARTDAGNLNVINRVPLEGYLKGVVPNEVPASWPAAALRAQAIAARSYALATRLGAAGFDLYDDTRSQVYGGASAEQSATNKAVRRTAADVVTYQGDVITAFFFSSSGGQTEDSQYGFSGGSSAPYLRSVEDPADRVSPYHRWDLTYSRGEMESMLGGLVPGKLRDIRVTKTGSSPRIVKAKLIGSAGKAAVSGEQLRFELGLRSTWARFAKVRR